MRGVLYRTDEDGNPLATPELKVSAINGSNIKVYANQEAKNAALENGDIKPGDVVLTGAVGREAVPTLDWDNVTTIVNQKNYTVLTDGIAIIDLQGLSSNSANGRPYILGETINGVEVCRVYSGLGVTIDVTNTTTVPVRAGDVLDYYIQAGSAVSSISTVKIVPYKFQ